MRCGVVLSGVVWREWREVLLGGVKLCGVDFSGVE